MTVDTEPSSVGHAAPDVSGWLTAAALFWFEAWGLMGLVAIAVFPLMAFMHGSWPPWTWADGTVLRSAALLASVGIGAVVAWASTGDRPRVRAFLFTAPGLIGLVATAAAATVDGYIFAGVALWLAWPSIVLVAVWGRRLLRADPASS
jgi:hypothetical protein